MAVNIGGINAHIGIDFGKLQKGIEQTAKQIENFAGRVKGIKIDAAIKGDPFSKTRVYFREAKSEVDKVFIAWKSSISSFNASLSKEMDRSQASVNKLIARFTVLQEKIKNTSNVSEVLKNRLTYEQATAGQKLGRGGWIDRRELIPEGEREGFVEGLKKLASDVPKYSTEINAWLNKFNKGIKVNSNLAKIEFDNLRDIINKANTTLRAETRQFGKIITQEFKTQERLKFVDQVKGARDVATALEKNRIEVKKLFVEEQRLRTEISQGINVKKNRIELLKVLQERQERGIKLTRQQNKELAAGVSDPIRYTALTREQQLLQQRAVIVSKIILGIADMNRQIKLGINIEENRKKVYNDILRLQRQGIQLNSQQIKQKAQIEQLEARRAKSSAITKLVLENKRITDELKKGVNLNKNIEKLEANILKLKQMNWRVSQNMTQTLTKARSEQKRLADETRKTKDTSDELFSREWFTSRARWFVQLRAFWAIWRKTIDALTGAVQFEQEMANVRAISQATTEQFEGMKKVALEVGSTTRFSAEEAAQAMVSLSQAGLDTYEIMNSIKSIAQLATATLHDFKETAELVTIVMRAWGKSSEDTQEIVDTLATATNETRLNMDRLSIGFNYIAGIAPKAGMSLKDTTAVLGMMANNGLRASTAGTSLRAVLAELLKPTQKFKDEVWKAGLTMEDVNPEFHNINDIMLLLKQHGWDAATAFRAFERRAAAGASIWVENADKLQDLSDRMHQVGRAAIMSEQNLDTIQGQWKQFADISIAVASGIMDHLSPALRSLANILGSLIKIIGETLEPLALLLSTIAEGLGNVYYILSGQLGTKFFKDEFTDPLKSITDELKNQEKSAQAIVDRFRTLRDAYTSYEKSVEKVGKVESQRAKEGLWKKALETIKEAKLFTDSELEALLDVNGQIKNRTEFEEAVNKKYRERFNIAAQEWTLTQRAIEARKTEAYSMALPGMYSLRGELEGIPSKLEGWKGTFKKMMDEYGAGSAGIDPRFRMLAIIPSKFIKSMNEEIEHWMYKEFYPYIQSLPPATVGQLLENQDFKKMYGAFLDAIEAENPVEEFIDIFFGGKESKVLKRIEANIQGFTDALGTTSVPHLTRDSIEDADNAYQKILDKLKQQKSQIEKASFATSEYDNQINKVYDTYDKLNKEIRQADLSAGEREKLLNIAFEQREEHLDNINTKRSFEIIKQQEQLKYDIELLNLADGREKSLKSLERERDKELQQARENFGIDTESNQLLEEINEKYRKRVELLNHEYDLKDKLLEYDREIYKLEEKRDLLDYLGNIDEQLKTEGELLKLRLKRLQEEFSYADKTKMTEEARLKLERDISKVQLDIIKNQKEQEKRANFLVDVYERLKEELKGMRMADFAMKSVGTARSGLADMIYNLTGGFEESKEKANELKGELGELNKELEETKKAIKEAIENDDIEQAEEYKNKAKEIKENMRLLGQEIKRVEDPIESLKDSFRNFFMSLIDGIRQAIAEWIAMQIVMGLIKMGTNLIGGGNSTVTTGASTSFELVKGTGGIIPNVKAFKSFSSGGLTGNPTLALLGDNPSKKELVIPSENIDKDKVSGYTRDKDKEETPINIINVLTKDDIAQAMTAPAGERVIINMIGKDLRRGGPLFKQMKG